MSDDPADRKNDTRPHDGRGSVSSLRDLRVWQVGTDLVEQVYRLTGSLPKHEEYGLVSQMRRAAVSVPSNVAEGHARWHGREYLHHLSIAQASLAELETQLESAARLAHVSPLEAGNILDQVTSLARQLRALRRSLSTVVREPDAVELRDLSP